MSFQPRTTAPSATDKNWINVNYGGKNHALTISSSTGSVLANCTGYVHGRWLELGLNESKLCLYNADQYYGYTRDGFERGQTPKLGAILCWSKTGKAGHVAIVEKIHGDGTVTASNSNYSGTRFYTNRINPKTWPSGYKFQGYIYPPIDFSGGGTGIGTPVARDKTRTQVQVNYDALRARSNPYLGDNVLGFINVGIYNVLEERDMTQEASNGYIWYKVEENVWIANVGSSEVTYLPATEEPKDYSALLKIGYASAGDVKQIKTLLDEMKIGYTEPEEGYIVTSVAPSKGDRDKIDVLCANLGIPCVEYASNDNATIEELKQKIDILEKENANLLAKNNNLKEEKENLENINSQLTSEKEALTKENAEVKNVLQDVKEISAELNDVLANA